MLRLQFLIRQFDYIDGWMKSSLADQDTPKEFVKMSFIFQYKTLVVHSLISIDVAVLEFHW